MKRLLVCLALAIFAGPAAACINDAELPTHEREFRSSYKSSPAPTPASTMPSLMGWAGAALLVGAAAVAYRGTGRGA